MDRRASIDERIKNLLTSTDLTFKQIIEQLRSENMPASFNTIRRVNRNHRYRKPRYDAKLTPQQRKELIIKLRNTTRPNLSSLARQYGVCHGSIWYWWDKLSKIREKNGGHIPNNEPSLEFDDIIEQDFLASGNGALNSLQETGDDNYMIADPDSDPLDLDNDEEIFETNDRTNNNLRKEYNHNKHLNKDNDNNQYDDHEDVDDDNSGSNDNTNTAFRRQNGIEDFDDLEMVGPVQAKNNMGEFVRLPIAMYARVSNSSIWNTKGSISDASPSSNSTPSTSSGGQSHGTLSRHLGVS